ncbi:GGDEF domain-containing protein [Clostridium sp. D2Q-11]|uniref:GGDEF domain-containing protein n=1 Tax=Anaeromonas frigoriresistens TaxID=2683708 RepID=A0A942Z9C1_9FIRM|nr:GGDEF domain-containing protein [Anaeromonas frigoriresistens]MBS4539168.1 GGDEF domain-containing protein [Anaeromonas frigoriresistens]
MIKEALSKEDSIVIIFDEEGNLEYSSIDTDNFKNIIGDKDKIKKELIDDRIVVLKDYIVKIEVLDLGFKKHFIASLYYISSKENNNLLSLAYTDKYTGLYNRNLWYKIEETIMNPLQSDKYCMIVIDIDSLNKINDIKGSSQGDKVIQDIAIAIKETTGVSDIAIRYGGDEFIIILTNSDEHKAIYILNTIRDKIKSIEYMDIDISGGVSYSQGNDSFKELFIKSNKNMISEKDYKKNQIISKLDDYNLIKFHLMNILDISENAIENKDIQNNIEQEINTILSLIYKKMYK